MKYCYLFECVIRGPGGVGLLELTCLQTIIYWHNADLMEELRDTGDIVMGGRCQVNMSSR